MLSGTRTSGGGVAGTVYKKVGVVFVTVFEVIPVVIGRLDVGVALVVDVADVDVVVPIVIDSLDVGVMLVVGSADVGVMVPVVGSARLQAETRERVATKAPPVVIPKRCRNCRLENL